MFSIKHLAAASVVALLPVAASANVLSFAFTGYVESTNDGANQDVASIGDLNVDDFVLGSFDLDTSLITGTAGATGSQSFPGAISNFMLTIDGYTYTDPGTGSASLHNDNMAGSAAPFRDMFFAFSSGANGADQGGLSASGFQFSLGGTDAFAAGSLSGLDLPTIAEFQSLFLNDNNNGNTKILTFADGSDVRYDVTSLKITTAAVPLPAPALLLLAGLGGLGAMKRRRKAA